jgi:long-subunit acyl-CoA synthetase (AMP-forming)
LIDLLASLERWASQRPAQPAFTWDGGAIGYGALRRRVAGAAAELAALPPVVGLLAEDGIDWVIADLAAGAAGKTLVPIPPFFSAQQIAHLIADAGVAHVLTDERLQPLIQPLGVPCSPVPCREAAALPEIAGGGRIIYTSGSTGTPKGVRLGGAQIGHSVRALAQASAADAEDRHLSVLPFALLLEQICGIYVVLHAGASSHIAAGAAARCAEGDPGALLQACEAWQPTTTVLVPQLLAALAGGYAALGRKAPASLRFVAVGGAAVPAALLEAAWAAGIPACTGYGLSECCSVVSVSRPGSRSHSAGPPLPGVAVEIEDGEIVVSGPTVMQGYLGGVSPEGRWATGDLGHFDGDGNLVVVGRRDNLLVTPNGRNVSPEWIEAMVERDPRIRRCVVVCGADGALTAVVTPAVPPQAPGDLAAAVSLAVRQAPAYARPTRCIPTSEDVIAGDGLLNGKGEPRRAAFAACFSGDAVPSQKIEVPLEFIAS